MSVFAIPSDTIINGLLAVLTGAWVPGFAVHLLTIAILLLRGRSGLSDIEWLVYVLGDSLMLLILLMLFQLLTDTAPFPLNL